MRSAQRLALVAALAVAGAIGCSDPDDTPRADAGADAGSIVEMYVAPPVIPWWDPDDPSSTPPIAPVVLTPCPTGWREVAGTGGEPVVCEPWPEAPVSCGEFEMLLPGTSTCARVGRACPAGDFPADLPATGVVFVLASAPAGGDGTRASPFRTIVEAFAVAPPGTVIAVGPGRYTDHLRPPPGITIRGACTSATFLVGVMPEYTVLRAERGEVTVEDLTVEDSVYVGLRAVGATTRLRVQGVVLQRTTYTAFDVVGGASLELRDSLVADTQVDSTGLAGYALLVQPGSHASLERVVVRGNRSISVGVLSATVSIADSAVIDTGDATSGRSQGIGIGAITGANVTLERVVMERNRYNHVFLDDRSAVTIDSSVLRDGQPQRSDGSGGGALSLEGGSTAEVRRSLIERNASYGIYVNREGARLVASDLVVRDTAGIAADTDGSGLFVNDVTSSADVSRAWFGRNRDASVYSNGALSLTDATIVDTRWSEINEPEMIGTAAGIAIGPGGGGWLARVLVRGTSAGAMGIVGPGSLTGEDVLVIESRSNPSGRGFGYGLSAALAEVSLGRVVIDRTEGVAVVARDSAVVDLADVVVRETTSLMRAGVYGRGINAQGASRVTIARARVDRSQDLGVFAHGTGTTVRLQDFAVLTVREQSCRDTTCVGTAFGDGIGAYFGAAVDATGFAVAGAERCGVQMAGDGAGIDLHRGVVTDAAIGACVQLEGYDLARLMDHVVFTRNEANLQATSLPVPEVYAAAP